MKEDTPASQIEEILSAFAELPKKAGTRIAQLTAGKHGTPKFQRFEEMGTLSQSNHLSHQMFIEEELKIIPLLHK